MNTLYTIKNGQSSVVGLTFDDIYPVGSIYMSVVNTNPGNLFGGTWVEWGSGRVPVGVDASDSNFDTVEKSVGGNTTSYTPGGSVSKPTFSGTAASLSHSGGAVQNHTLSTNEIPAHSHYHDGYKNEKWLINVNPNNAGTMIFYAGAGGTAVTAVNSTVDVGTGGGQAHSHGFTQPSAHSYTPAGSVSQPSFTGTAANISTIQKSITCYMWKRTA